VNRSAFVAGILFALGLVFSGMTDPQRVLAFLDFTSRHGPWDFRLALVMASAIAVAAPAFWWARKRRHGFGGVSIVLPARSPVTARLLTGAALFGLGWGLSGLCPGPALVGAAGGNAAIAVFVLAMVGGLLLVDVIDRYIHRT
jgi:uncharacterized protein